MTKKEIKSAIENLNVSDNLRTIVAMNDEYTRVKYLIKSICARNAPDERLAVLINKMAKIRIGAVISNYITIVNKDSMVNDYRGDEKKRASYMTAIETWVTSVKNNFRDVLACATYIYSVMCAGNDLNAERNLAKLKNLESAVNATAEITTLKYIRSKTKELSALIDTYANMLPQDDLLKKAEEIADEIAGNEAEATDMAEITAEVTEPITLMSQAKPEPPVDFKPNDTLPVVTGNYTMDDFIKTA